ncbi:MAG TPA: hypothetical protein VI172_07735, partial [Candidatus Dormibacteraeota bacterium]
MDVEATLGRLFGAIRLALFEATQKKQEPGGLDLRFMSSLAPGADQAIAKAASAHGFQLMTVVPGTRESYYQRLIQKPEWARAALAFDCTIACDRSSLVVELAKPEPALETIDRESTRLVVEHSDLVVALWTGEEPKAESFTAYGVRVARDRGIPIIHIDPAMPAEWTFTTGRF